MDAKKIRAHISNVKARIDFKWPANIASTLPEIQQKAQEVIDYDLPIGNNFLNELEERRCWKVKGFAQVPCGCIHLSKSGVTPENCTNFKVRKIFGGHASFNAEVVVRTLTLARVLLILV